MKLKILLQGLDVEVKGTKDIDISGLSSDSRTCGPKHLFIARKGLAVNGIDFINQAISAGAVAIVTHLYNPFIQVTQVITPDPSLLIATLATKFYQNPTKDLFVVGITGSKGKTTTSYLIHHLLTKLGSNPGLIGTVEMIVGDKRYPSSMTTHDVITNQKSFAEMKSVGAKSAVVEVSSHGLHQKRVEGVHFDIGLFTNLYPDHLDYHHDIESYAKEKKKLFQMAKFAIYNADSSWTPFMMEKGDHLTFGFEKKADVQGENILFHPDHTSFTIDQVPFQVPLQGKFNLSNLLGAIAVGIHLKIDLPTLAKIFSEIPSISGRLEKIPNPLGLNVFVDFAHTGPALESVLETLKPLTQNRVIVVFGAGGGRDPARRVDMGKAACHFADLIILTNDNPRKEDPEEICRQILTHIPREKVIVELDRAKAIGLAIQKGEKGDTILIAGKGHEKKQIFSHQTIPFDDVQIAKEELKKREASAILSVIA